MKFFKRSVPIALGLALLFGGVAIGYNQYQATKYNDISVLDILLRGNDILDSSGTTRINIGSTNTLTGNATITGDTTFKGDRYIESSTAVSLSTETSQGTVAWAYLDGSTTALVGHMLCYADASLGTSVGVTVQVCNNSADRTDWAGPCSVQTSTGSVVGYYTSGFAIVRSTNSVSVGDTLVTSSTDDGYVKPDATPTTGADIGVALDSGDAGGDSILMRLRQ